MILARHLKWRDNGKIRLSRHLKWRDNEKIRLSRQLLNQKTNYLGIYMEKIETKNEKAIIMEMISNHYPDGVSLVELLNATRLTLPKRTFQRRLAHLLKDKRLFATGRGRNTRYHILRIVPQIEIEDVSLITYPPISREAESIKQAVNAPLETRHPVSYNFEFLKKYKPNETFYLSTGIRKLLKKIGTPPDGKQQPVGTYARKIFHRLLIDLSWNSSRLEGNTYSLLDTKNLIDFSKVAEGKSLFETQMILNHKAAIEFLVESSSELQLDRHTILSLHALLANNLLSPESIGRLRMIPVGVAKTVYHPLENPHLVEEYFQQIINAANIIQDPFEQAFFIMIHIPYLQAFEDVNKRVSRLALNIPFIKHNLSPLSFIGVSEQAYVDGLVGIYEFNKVELMRDIFVWAYERSAAHFSAIKQSLGEPDPFRLRYHAEMIEIISEIIKQKTSKKNIDSFVKKWIYTKIPLEDRDLLTKVINEELEGLHEGNIARFRVRLSEFKAWINQQS